VHSLFQAERDEAENQRIENARKQREALLAGKNAAAGRELTQAERDDLEVQRIERARKDREALLSGKSTSSGRELTQVLFDGYDRISLCC